MRMLERIIWPMIQRFYHMSQGTSLYEKHLKVFLDKKFCVFFEFSRSTHLFIPGIGIEVRIKGMCSAMAPTLFKL